MVGTFSRVWHFGEIHGFTKALMFHRDVTVSMQISPTKFLVQERTICWEE